MTYEAFGASRIMWGSDFPPVAGREGYRNALQSPMDHIPFRNDADKEMDIRKDRGVSVQVRGRVTC
jgi:predicted TIM-barrel fold metal-dependent hydrolase